MQSSVSVNMICPFDQMMHPGKCFCCARPGERVMLTYTISCSILCVRCVVISSKLRTTLHGLCSCTMVTLELPGVLVAYGFLGSIRLTIFDASLVNLHCLLKIAGIGIVPLLYTVPCHCSNSSFVQNTTILANVQKIETLADTLSNF